MKIRLMQNNEETAACEMMKICFDEFIAPYYSEQGINEFYKYTNAESLRKRQTENHFTLVAESHDQIVGVIEVRNTDHVSLLFVNKEYHGRGIAKALLETAITKCRAVNPDISEISVNSSPYAVAIYEKLGFKAVDEQKTVNGIISTPMVMKIKNKDDSLN